MSSDNIEQDEIVSEDTQTDESQLEEKNNDQLEQDNEEETKVDEPVQRKRGMPKGLLAKQQAYQQVLERQQKLKGKSNGHKNVDVTANNPVRKKVITGGRKVNINGVIRIVKDTKHEPETAVIEETNEQEIKKSDEQEIKKSEQEIQTETETKTKRITTGSKRIPPKYAKNFEQRIKDEAIKKAKNFSELRRIKTMQSIDSSDVDIDITKATMQDLRKQKTLQRKKEMAEEKKRNETKKSSPTQIIMDDPNMSKLSKHIAIKNLSANSRHKQQSNNIKQKISA